MESLKLVNENNEMKFNGVMDIELDSLGRLQMIEGIDKLKQGLRKSILTLSYTYLGEKFGSELWSYVGQKRSIGLKLRIKQSVIDSLSDFIDSQKKVVLGIGERIDKVVRVSAEEVGRGFYLVDILILTSLGREVEISLVVS